MNDEINIIEEHTNEEPLVHLIYTSAAIEEFSEEHLTQLLQIARKKNQENNISGMLLYHDCSFFQIIEGEKRDIDNLYDIISVDQRHTHIVKIIEESINERDFADWTMGRANVSFKDLKSIPGLNDFFKTNQLLRDIPEGRARELLEAFKKGKWRQSIK